MADSDPLRSLSRQPAHVTVHGAELRLQWHPALDWIETLRRDPDLVALALAEQPDAVVLGLVSGTVPRTAVADASHGLLESETGYRWWTALKLAYSSAGGAVLGELTLSGVDPARVSFGQWCSAVYRILTKDADEKGRLKIDFELELPPPGYEEAWDDGNDFAAMVALARQYEQQ